jgi:hypothetical protein
MLAPLQFQIVCIHTCVQVPHTALASFTVCTIETLPSDMRLECELSGMTTREVIVAWTRGNGSCLHTNVHFAPVRWSVIMFQERRASTEFEEWSSLSS